MSCDSFRNCIELGDVDPLWSTTSGQLLIERKSQSQRLRMLQRSWLSSLVLRKHSYIAKVQLQSIRSLKDNLQPEEAVLQEYSSKNFIIKQMK